MLRTCVNTYAHAHNVNKWIETFFREQGKKGSEKKPKTENDESLIRIYYKISWTRYYFVIVICSPFMNDGNDDIAHKLAAVHKRTKFIAVFI